MNYRHIYHAGNIGDVVKHVTLFALLTALRQKPTPFVVLDTHAGCGRYDLRGEAAAKTGEAEDGIGAVLKAGALTVETGILPQDYLAALAGLNPGLVEAGKINPAALRIYPGSPWLITGMLRAEDRYIGCELLPDDFRALRYALPRQPQWQLHRRDGYEGLLAFTPPPEKRGLALIDPPYEQPDEFDRLAETLIAAHGRWPGGVYAAWYPVKDRPAIWRWHERMAASGIRKQLILEFIFEAPAASGMQGSGMLVINPPWQLAGQMAEAYGLLHQALRRPVQETKIAWLVTE